MRYPKTIVLIELMPLIRLCHKKIILFLQYCTFVSGQPHQKLLSGITSLFSMKISQNNHHASIIEHLITIGHNPKDKPC